VSSFLPDTNNAVSTLGADTTGADGSYRLQFKSPAGIRSGIAPGKYKVLVRPATTLDGVKIPEEWKHDPKMYLKRLGIDETEKKNRGMRTAKGARDPDLPEGEFDAEVRDEGGTFNFAVKAPPLASKPMR
jgi:hypothetical protein